MADTDSPKQTMSLNNVDCPILEPSQTTSSSFPVSWSPSKASALDSSRVQLNERLPRAWERSPHSPAAEDSRFKKVWRSHNLRSTSTQQDGDGSKQIRPTQPSPQRHVKKARTTSTRQTVVASNTQSPPKFVATKWDRRKSNLPRKQPQLVEQTVQVEVDQQDIVTKEEEEQQQQQQQQVSVQEETIQEDATVDQISDDLIDMRTPVASRSIKISSNSSIKTSIKFRKIISEPDLLQDLPVPDKTSMEGSRMDALDPEFASPALDNEDNPNEQEQEPQSEQAPVLQNSIHQHEKRLHQEELNSEEVQTDASPEAHDQVTQDIKSPSEHVQEIDIITDDSPEADSPSQQQMASSAISETVVELHGILKTAKSLVEDAIAITQPQSADPDFMETETSEDLPEIEVIYSPQNEDESAESPETPSKQVQDIDNDQISPVLEEITTTITLTTSQYMEEDKAFLQSFLDRAAASKANKANIENTSDDNCTSRESVQNRRDSDAVRIALASPGRLPLESKDVNLCSPKKSQDTVDNSPTMKKSPALSSDTELVLPDIDDLLANPPKTSSPRRSVRSRSVRRTTVNSAPHQISVRRGDDTLTLSVTKTELQTVVNETRRNTRKNKGPALPVFDRLVKWKAELVVLGKDGQSPDPTSPKKVKKKNVVWSEELEFLNEATGKPEKAPLVNNEPAPGTKAFDAEDPALPATEEPESTQPTKNSKKPRSQRSTSTPKIRRLRGLGAANGTPAKGILSSTITPDEQSEDIHATSSINPPPEFSLPSPSSSTIADPTTKTTTTTTKSRLPAPKKLLLTPSVKSVNEKAATVASALENDTMTLFTGRSRVPGPSVSGGRRLSRRT